MTDDEIFITNEQRALAAAIADEAEARTRAGKVAAGRRQINADIQGQAARHARRSNAIASRLFVGKGKGGRGPDIPVIGRDV
jgi:hypothetical protein